MTDPRVTFVRYQIAWMLATILVLVAAGRFSLEGYYVISVIGFFLVAEATTTDHLRLAWRRRVRVIGVLLLVGFVGVVVWQVQGIVANGA